MASDVVRKIGFTGSTRVGKMLFAQAADTVKKVSLELGGNAPFIVFDDADLEAAASSLVASAFRNAGQTCICANRVLVQVQVRLEALSAGIAPESIWLGFTDRTCLARMRSECRVVHNEIQILCNSDSAGCLPSQE